MTESNRVRFAHMDDANVEDVARVRPPAGGAAE
jgi:hypothetical protein